ncbi:hypothetical protein QLS71_012245 [Mariniflexile litorale]|uniref:Uncharacterized protein n=1 Tax=Mariniflexile litorale TaxID=3045158 RepID=A0AAU7EBU5_9FLAO|nr:hypothetical protein [Mariniflexile sp. KMM 9835]MDQ8213446.1 hypothetical protein [Mariniflexile sp. KMM 9835]
MATPGEKLAASLQILRKIQEEQNAKSIQQVETNNKPWWKIW